MIGRGSLNPSDGAESMPVQLSGAAPPSSETVPAATVPRGRRAGRSITASGGLSPYPSTARNQLQSTSKVAVRPSAATSTSVARWRSTSNRTALRGLRPGVATVTRQETRSRTRSMSAFMATPLRTGSAGSVPCSQSSRKRGRAPTMTSSVSELNRRQVTSARSAAGLSCAASPQRITSATGQRAQRHFRSSSMARGVLLMVLAEPPG